MTWADEGRGKRLKDCTQQFEHHIPELNSRMSDETNPKVVAWSFAQSSSCVPSQQDAPHGVVAATVFSVAAGALLPHSF